MFLCTQARNVLTNIKRGKGNELVFKGQYSSPIDIDNYWQAIRRKAKLGSVRIHDIRHSYASQAARLYCAGIGKFHWIGSAPGFRR